MKNYFFTSESVSEGHPDKIADQVSDAILDSLLEQDPKSRVACETMISTGFITLAGEITTQAKVDYEAVARQTVKEIGYNEAAKGFDGNTCKVNVHLDEQSPDIAQGVGQDCSGAGDQGLMFGYAVNETEELMPLTIDLSHKLVKDLARLRKSGNVNYLRPDSKSQITAQYENGKVKRIDTVLISTQHSEDVTNDELKDFITNELIQKTVPSQWMDKETKILINPTGRFVVGGPYGDCGLTGRKIIVDTYGGHGAHGGGAFSGKDPSKVDRSAAYAARHIAKNIVAAELADRCLVQVAYAIGVSEPMSVMIDDYGANRVDSEKLCKAIQEIWSLKPSDIIKDFDLLKPRYKVTAAYGHFGRSDDSFTWETLSKVNDLKSLI